MMKYERRRKYKMQRMKYEDNGNTIEERDMNKGVPASRCHAPSQVHQSQREQELELTHWSHRERGWGDPQALLYSS